MWQMFKSFRADQDGAVTVDWVVLTAALVALGLVVGSSVGGGTTTLANDLAADMAAQVTP